MSGWNVTLSWFVLHLLLTQMFIGCFVIDEILVLITVEKSGLRLLIFFVNGMCVLISWLIYDLFIENLFHWYNRLSSSMFLAFFINRYSLPIYHFC